MFVLRSVCESLLVFAIMTGILLPVRLLFVQYVSDNWFGSLGIISVLTFVVILLAKKNKLGFFGPMLERQIFKFQKGKRGYVVFGESVFLLLILGGMIFAIHQGNSTVSEILHLPAISSADTPELILDSTKHWGALEWFTSFLMIPVAFLTSFPEMSVIIASIDQKLDGWLLHFYTVGFVEYLELLGILLFYRLHFRKKSVFPKNSLSCKSSILKHRE
ncbi:hypothetical protein NsoK4_02900 [Nitrosopumilus sp. K4]|uniref:hypothetical protein n=1 Tax=Nitrosopumilus sp. K4 TaxID=2795383 RepID=UPI001BACFFD3|nr:hypothetical protein NsoK4_02900 [Nitrosopumilus sp. K4]